LKQKLYKCSSLTLSPDSKSEMTELINKELTEEQQQLYIINLYMCMNFHPTTDFPVDLDHVYKQMGFANKGNAMKTIKSNFTKDEDYKISLEPKEKSSWGGSGSDKITLNIDTYKTLCMLVKTTQGKEIRKYYVKLENIYNSIIKKEIENTQKLLEENKEEAKREVENSKMLLKEKENLIKELENKPNTIGFFRKHGYIYAIKDTSKPGNNVKLGYATTPNDRIATLNVGSSTSCLKILSTFETFDITFAENNELLVTNFTFI